MPSFFVYMTLNDCINLYHELMIRFIDAFKHLDDYIPVIIMFHMYRTPPIADARTKVVNSL